MRGVSPTHYPSTNGTNVEAKPAVEPLTDRVQRKRFVSPLNRCSGSDNSMGFNVLSSTQSRISAKKERLMFAYQTVKDQSFIFAIEKNSTASEVTRFEWSNMNGFFITNRGRHAWPPRLEIDGGVLLEQAGYNGDVRMGFLSHREEF